MVTTRPFNAVAKRRFMRVRGNEPLNRHQQELRSELGEVDRPRLITNVARERLGRDVHWMTAGHHKEVDDWTFFLLGHYSWGEFRFLNAEAQTIISFDSSCRRTVAEILIELFKAQRMEELCRVVYRSQHFLAEEYAHPDEGYPDDIRPAHWSDQVTDFPCPRDFVPWAMQKHFLKSRKEIERKCGEAGYTPDFSTATNAMTHWSTPLHSFASFAIRDLEAEDNGGYTAIEKLTILDGENQMLASFDGSSGVVFPIVEIFRMWIRQGRTNYLKFMAIVDRHHFTERDRRHEIHLHELRISQHDFDQMLSHARRILWAADGMTDFGMSPVGSDLTLTVALAKELVALDSDVE